MRGTDHWSTILGLEEPWFVERVAIDSPSRRVDLVLSLNFVKKSFFDSTHCCPKCGTEYPGDVKMQVLRHLNLGDMRAYLEIPVFGGLSNAPRKCPCARTWNSPGSRFTLAMERHIENALRLLKSLEAVTTITGITLEEAREFNGRRSVLREGAGTQAGVRQASQNGIEVSYLEESEEAAPAPAAAPAPKPAAAGVPPPDSHPVWLRIAVGQTPVRTHDIALRLLLEQVRLSLAANPTAVAQFAAIRMVRQYFVKYWARYGTAFLRFLAPGGAASASAPAAPDIPHENDPCWQRLLDGSVTVGGDALGLNMLLERLRLYLGAGATAEERLAAARSLRQYFAKYRHRLRPALDILRAAGAQPAPRGPARPLPEEGDPCWQRWLGGEIEIRTEHVGLSFLIERLRQALAADPSPAAAGFAARTLRQFFSKYEGRLGREIEQLPGLAAPGGGGEVRDRGNVVEFVEIPPDDHPSWRQLINGQVELATGALGLKLLLEQVRLSLGADPSEATLQAGTRVMRQYFLKNRARHRREIEQLKIANN